MEYDELLTNHLGEFGLYQKIIFFIISLTAVPAAFNIMSTVFIVGVPDHWCAIPELDVLEIPTDIRLNVSIPLEEVDGDMVYNSCEMYSRNYTNWNQYDVEDALSNSQNGSSIMECTDGWIYDQSLYTSTVVSDATSASIYMAGMMVGVIVSGAISDQIGRKLTMCICIVLMVCINVGIAFVQSIYTFMALRFFLSMVTISQYTCAFVMGIELVGPSWRVHVGTIIQYYWAFGYMLVAGIAYGLRDWRHLQLAISVPFVVLFLFFFIPESPRWLYMTKRTKRADKVVKIMAKLNKKELPEKLEITVKQTKRAFVWDIMRTPRMRLRSFNMFFNWFVNSFVYYGLSLNTSDLAGNIYVNFFISGAVEIPAYIFTQIVPSIIGRRLSLAGTLILAGVALLLTLAVPDDLNTIAIVLAMIGKFAISASFAIIYIFTAELYPTPVRNVCVGSGSFFARVGGIIAPYVGQLSDYGKFIPLVIFGVVSIAAGFLSLFFPETKGQNLPETMEDGENFGVKGYTHSSMQPSADEEKDHKQKEGGFSNTGFDDIDYPNGVLHEDDGLNTKF